MKRNAGVQKQIEKYNYGNTHRIILGNVLSIDGNSIEFVNYHFCFLFFSLKIQFSLFVWVLWHINLCRLFNAKFIFIQINSFISSNTVHSLIVKNISASSLVKQF